MTQSSTIAYGELQQKYAKSQIKSKRRRREIRRLHKKLDIYRLILQVAIDHPQEWAIRPEDEERLGEMQALTDGT